jgi:hypothetical protein
LGVPGGAGAGGGLWGLGGVAFGWLWAFGMGSGCAGEGACLWVSSCGRFGRLGLGVTIIGILGSLVVL